jgi:outer membrane protein OmpA-like peptidoglycan-associated protein
MNKRSSLLLGLLLCVPACMKKTTPPSSPSSEEASTVTLAKAPSIPSESHKSSPKPLFDDDVEGFVLEEPGNTFNSPLEETEDHDIKVVEQDLVDDAWIDKRLEQTQEYGLKTIYFRYDDSSIRPDQKPVLDYDLKRVADLVRKGMTVIVEGHSCHLAKNTQYNIMLSEERAKTVADYFIQKGVPREKLKVVGRGDEMCIIPEGDIEQQAPNRRVEFYVLSEGDSAA